MLFWLVMWKPLMVVAVLAGVAVADTKVTVRSTTDDSHSSSTEVERKKHEEIVRRTIDHLVARAPVTFPENRTVDASIVSLTTELVGSTMVVTSTLRLMVSDDAGRITAVLSGSAKAEKVGATPSSLDQLRKEALVGSLEGIYSKVKRRLHGAPAE